MIPWHFVLSMIIGILFCLFDLSFRIDAYTIRIERLITITSFLIFFGLCIQSVRRGLFRLEYMAITAWIVLGLLASLLAVSPLLSLRHWLDLSLAVSLFIIASYWRLERLVFTFSKTISPMILLLGGGGVITTLALDLNLAGYSSWLGHFVVLSENYFRIRMTMYEPNLYGAMMMVLSLLTVSMFNKHRPTSWLMLLLSHAGLILSVSKGPIVGYFFGLSIYYYCIGKAGRYFKSMFVLLLLALVLVLFSATQTTIKDYSRINDIETRLISYKLAFSDIQSSPLWGSGIYSFSFMHPGFASMVGSSDEKHSDWISNIFLAVLHDTGLIGLALFSIFFYLLFSRAYRAIIWAKKNGLPPGIIRAASAWLAAGCGILVSSLATSAYSLGFFWIVMAVIAVIPRAMRGVYPAILQFQHAHQQVCKSNNSLK